MTDPIDIHEIAARRLGMWRQAYDNTRYMQAGPDAHAASERAVTEIGGATRDMDRVRALIVQLEGQAFIAECHDRDRALCEAAHFWGIIYMSPSRHD